MKNKEEFIKYLESLPNGIQLESSMYEVLLMPNVHENTIHNVPLSKHIYFDTLEERNEFFKNFQISIREKGFRLTGPTITHPTFSTYDIVGVDGNVPADLTLYN